MGATRDEPAVFNYRKAGGLSILTAPENAIFGRAALRNNRRI